MFFNALTKVEGYHEVVQEVWGRASPARNLEEAETGQRCFKKFAQEGKG